MGRNRHTPLNFRHAHILQDFQQSGATVEDLARAMASLDGHRDTFDSEKNVAISDVVYGHYLGYLAEAEEVLQRAAQYARDRAAKSDSV